MVVLEKEIVIICNYLVVLETEDISRVRDWLLACNSNISGYYYHYDTETCLFCHKQSTYTTKLSPRHLIPLASKTDMKQVTIVTNAALMKWRSLEYPSLRHNEEMRNTWSLPRNAQHKSKVNEIVLSKEIMPISIILKPSLDVVHGYPQYYMRQLFLGCKKHLLSLCIRNHKTCEKMDCSFILTRDQIESINQTPSRSSTGIKPSWGRLLRSLTHLSRYKVEDFKNIALFYSSCLFSDGFVSIYMANLWYTTCEICFTVFYLTSASSDYLNLKFWRHLHMRYSLQFVANPKNIHSASHPRPTRCYTSRIFPGNVALLQMYHSTL